jgi:hypothetical protein
VRIDRGTRTAVRDPRNLNGKNAIQARERRRCGRTAARVVAG